MNQNVLNAKKETVEEIKSSLADAGSLTVVSYHGLTVAELQELRRTLKKDGASFTVYKNTLIKRALKDAALPNLDEYLEGPNAFVFSKELSKGPKDLVKFARLHEALVIKGGLAEGQVLDAAKVKEVSKLPDKNGLISMFLSVLNAPITNFAATVKAVAEKAGGNAPAAN